MSVLAIYHQLSLGPSYFHIVDDPEGNDEIGVFQY